MLAPKQINRSISWQCRSLNFCLKFFVRQKLIKLFSERQPDIQFKNILKFRKMCDQFSIENKSQPQKDLVINDIKAKWFYAKNPNAPIILYFHGGAYIMGSIKVYSNLCAELSKRCDVNVLYFDYPLSPEYSFSTRLQQSVIVYQWLLKNYPKQAIIFAGDSAGGGLELATALYLRDHSYPLPACIIGFSPFTDLTFTGESLKTNAHKDPFICIPYHLTLINEVNVKNKYVSPLYGDFNGFPPLLIQVGEDEILRDDSTRVATKADENQVPVTLEIWKHVPHAWPIFAGFLPEAKEALDHVCDFIKEKI